MHKYINLDNLPKHKNNIDWINSIGKTCYFEYDNIKGIIEIVDYDINNKKVNIKYKDKTYKIATAGDHREGMIRISGVNWFTNMEIKKRHEELDLVCRYSPDEYPTYENFNAIDVSKVRDIPYDYVGLMGVPDTILCDYNPEQFEIIGMGSGDLAKQAGVQKNYRGRTDLAFEVNVLHKCPNSRIIIRNKHPRQ